jgi:hypothetical protein
VIAGPVVRCEVAVIKPVGSRIDSLKKRCPVCGEELGVVFTFDNAGQAMPIRQGDKVKAVCRKKTCDWWGFVTQE